MSTFPFTNPFFFLALTISLCGSSRPLSISLTLSLSLPSHLFPFSSPLPLQIDFAATWPRRNAITLSVCSLFPFFLFFFTLALFFSFDYARPFYLPSARDIAQPYRGDGVVPGALCFQSRSVPETDTYTRCSTRVSRATRLPRRLSTMLDNTMSVHGNVARCFCYGRYLSRLEYPLSSEPFPGFVRGKRGVRRFRVYRCSRSFVPI